MVLNRIQNVEIVNGIRFLQDVLWNNDLLFEYVTHSDKVHKGLRFITHTGIPVMFIQQSGVSGYYLHIDTMDEDFNRVEGYMIRFNTEIDKVLMAQAIFTRLFIQHESEKVDI